MALGPFAVQPSSELSMEKDQIAKLVCIAIGCVAGFYIFMWMLPYIELFLSSMVLVTSCQTLSWRK